MDAFLTAVAAIPTPTPTLAQIAGACDDFAGPLAEAVEAGLVAADEDLGPETRFVLTPLAAERLGVELTYDSKRWVYRGTRELVGEHEADGRAMHYPRPRRSEQGLGVSLGAALNQRIAFGAMLRHGLAPRREADPKQPEPWVELAAVEERARRPYSSDNPPPIRHHHGLGAIWKGEEFVSPDSCPYHPSAGITIDGYCHKCHAAGMDPLLPKVDRSRRRQMPRGKSKLKGGV